MSEKDEAKRDGSTLVKNSGRGRGTSKGDAVLDPFLVDYKEYEKSYSITESNWAKVSTDAIHNGRRQPAIKVVLGKEGEQRLRLWIIGDKMFHEMLEAWKQKYEFSQD